MERDEIKIIPKGEHNLFGSTTGPYKTQGGWGTPASEDDRCPKCGSAAFRYTPGCMEGADNICLDCGYSESFMY